MPVLTAENSFREGLVALVEGRPADASRCFESAMQTERNHSTARPQMRYLSYYGLSFAMAHGPTREAIRACETAASNEFYNPDMLLNLGKVYMMAGKTTRAMEAFERGIRLSPRHKGLKAAQGRSERRKRRSVGWLRRDHPVNYWLGRMRAPAMRNFEA